jgi:hypothetical protein
MKGDFTRMTFNKDKRFSRVLMQQGRVQLDADWNEQADILVHYLRTLAADLIGPHGGPGDSFAIEKLTDEDGNSIPHNFVIRQGHYYVDGILCDNNQDVTFQGEPNAEPPYPSQPDYPLPQNVQLADGDHLIYLDVWERHISYLEDEDEHGDEPSIREVALGGADTATRAMVVWQVKTWHITGEREAQLEEMGIALGCDDFHEAWQDVVNLWWQPANRGRMQARAKLPEDADLIEPCIIDPEARYRGAENQLYRVEIHRGGPSGTATFKWSRENGSVVFPIVKIQGSVITLEHLGRDERFGLRAGDRVEIVDDGYILRGDCVPLLKVEKLDPDSNQVTLSGAPTIEVEQEPFNHPLLRRWDHKEDDPTKKRYEMREGAIVVAEGENWIPLEDGVEIRFPSPGQNLPGSGYRTHDYWLIPARTATGDVEWPGSIEDPALSPPHGTEHHYAPLAIISVNDVGDGITVVSECRRTIPELAQPV